LQPILLHEEEKLESHFVYIKLSIFNA
jgi:hypothetical protein